MAHNTDWIRERERELRRIARAQQQKPFGCRGCELEDRPFVGRAGQRLDEVLRECGIDREEIVEHDPQGRPL